jgi:GT2 family glycosyltransferase
LDSLWTAQPKPGQVFLIDDASTEDAVTQIAAWAQSAAIPYRIITAGALDRVLGDDRWLTLVSATTNAGFVRSCNIGLRYVRDFTGAPYVLLLNNDAAVSTDYFFELARALEMAPCAGLLTGAIYEWDRSTVWYGGATFNPLRALATHTTELPENESPSETGYVCGCSMLISRQVLEQVGLLAECFQPAYVEDVDYSLRVSSAGFPVMITPRAVCYHRVGSSLGRTKQSPSTVFSVNRNRAFTLRRNYDGWRRVAGIAYLGITKPTRAAWELAKGRPRIAWAVLAGTMVGVFSPAALGD